MAGVLSHFDGWQAILNSLGDNEKDRTRNVEFNPDLYGYQELRRLRRDPLCRAFVEQPSRAMFRRGVTVLTGTKQVDQSVAANFKAAKLHGNMRRAVEFAAAYGGGAVLLGFDDGLDPAMPVRQGARLVWTRALTNQQLRVLGHHWNENPFSSGYEEPTLWTAFLRRGGQLHIHPSRLLIFLGQLTDNEDRRRLQGWGESLLASFAAKAADLDLAFRSLLNILSEFSVKVLGMKGLAELLEESEGSDGVEAVQTRVQAQNLAMRSGRTVLHDAEEETFQQISANISGYAEALDRVMLLLCGAAERPATIFFGRSPAGLSATGESDIRSWYDSLQGRQVDELGPHFEYVAHRVLDSMALGGVWHGEYSVEFPPLWTPTELEAEDIKGKRSERLGKEVDRGILSPEEAAIALHGGDDSEVDIDVEGRQAMQKPAGQRPPVAQPAAPPPAVLRRAA
jgi:phage-related protein (TIGR01555 family)